MLQPPKPSFIQNLQRRAEQGRRLRERRWAERDMARRQDEVLRSAAGAKQARQRAVFFQNLRRDAAGRGAALGQALRWDALRRSGQDFGGGPGRPKLRRFLSRLVYAVAAFSLIANVVLYTRWSPARPLLSVGKHVVSRRDYENGLDAAAGRAVLSRIVLAEVVRQAAARAGVTPSAADIDARLAVLRRQGAVPSQDSPALRDAVAQDLALENLRIQGIPATEAEIAAEYAKRPAEFSLPAQMKATLVVAPSAAGAAQAAHLLSVGAAPSAIAATPGLRVDGVDGFAIPPGALPPGLRQAMLALKDGQVRTFPAGGAALVVRANAHVPGLLPPLAQIRDEVARQVRLEKAPGVQAEMLALYAANRPVFDMTNYQPFLAGIDAAAAKTPGDARPAPPAKTASLPPSP